jgi:serine/threonine-protein kinase
MTVPVEQGQILAGKYRIERTLGSGGMGVVVAAWHVEIEQRVALKFLRPELCKKRDSAERFRREAIAAAKIKSEHVARVLDVGTTETGVPYIVMEYLDGNDLADEIKRYGRLPVADSIDYVLQAIEALAEAHAAGIVHRDLKPHNLFLARRADGSRSLKVLDFGIAKSLIASGQSFSLTSTTTVIGSPLYMAPEQMQSPKSVDARADIWSLGAILYHMLAGRPPYDAPNVAQLCSVLLETTAPLVSEIRSDVPVELARVIDHCLEKERVRRCGSVSELATLLEPFGSGSSAVHASRAARILNTSDVPVSGFDPAVPTARDRAATVRRVALLLAALLVAGLTILVASMRLRQGPATPAGGAPPATASAGSNH